MTSEVVSIASLAVITLKPSKGDLGSTNTVCL